MPERDTAYAVLTNDEYETLQGLSAGNDTLQTILGYYTGYAEGYWYAVDSDALADLFWTDEGVEFLDFYNGGWYMFSTKWVQGV